MNRKLFTAIAVSIFIHAAFFIGVAWWSVYNLNPLGGGGGVVEVAVVGDEKGTTISSLQAKQSNTAGVILKSERDEGSQEHRGIATAPSEVHNDATTPSPLAGEGGGEGGNSGSGEGAGSDKGPGDPRLVAIWKKINRAKYYPEMARRQGLEGAPKVAFSISENGKVGGVKVVESSGNEILDKAAVEAIQNSAPLPFYPQPITIAVRYSLKEHKY